LILLPTALLPKKRERRTKEPALPEKVAPAVSKKTPEATRQQAQQHPQQQAAGPAWWWW